MKTTTTLAHMAFGAVTAAILLAPVAHSDVDTTAFQSATFLKGNLDRTTSTQQVWQFLATAVQTYCPDQTPALRTAADSSRTTTQEDR